MNFTIILNLDKIESFDIVFFIDQYKIKQLRMDRKANHINTAAEKKYSVIIKKLQAANVNTFHMLLI